MSGENPRNFIRRSIAEGRKKAHRSQRPMIAAVQTLSKRLSKRPAAMVQVSPQRESKKIPLANILSSNAVVVETKNVEILVESFREAGQTSAILVRKEHDRFVVISGHHRVAAAKALGWNEIDAVLLHCDERSQELITIADDLHRRSHSVLERSEKQNQWIELLRPEVMQIAPPSGGRQPKDKGLGKVARVLGVPKEQTMRAARIASISNEAKQKARELGLDDNQSALLRVSKATTPGAQIVMLQEIYEAKNAPRARRVSRKKAEPAAEADTIMATGAEAPELSQDAERLRVASRQEQAPGLLPEYPDMLREFERRSLDAEFKKLTDEWRSSRLLRMLGCAPLEARERFIWEVLFSEFPDAFVTALPGATKGGAS
jgi:hypothetical protein